MFLASVTRPASFRSDIQVLRLAFAIIRGEGMKEPISKEGEVVASQKGSITEAEAGAGLIDLSAR